MGANANQDGAHGGQSSLQRGGGGGASAGNPSNGNPAAAAAGNTSTEQALKHNPGLSIDWSPDEQTALEEGLAKYASDSNIVRYAKIAMQLEGKTVRDVVLRCRWMSKKESGKRRKEDHNLRKSKDKKERVTDSSGKSSAHLAARPNVPPFSLPLLPMDNDDEISCKEIGGPTGQLLERNAQIFNQIYANIGNLQIQDNVSLLCQTRDNILSIMNDINDMPGVMKQMPQLPVRINEELANSILPRTSMPTSAPMQS